MKEQVVYYDGNLLNQVYNSRKTQKQNIYKLKSYLPEIKNLGRGNNLLNITRDTLNNNQMLYLDFYQGSGIRLLQKSPQSQHEEDDENLTYGKVKVIELTNLSDKCKRTLSYFSGNQDLRNKRDIVRKNILNKLHILQQSKQINNNSLSESKSKQKTNSLRKKFHLNVAQRNRSLPKKQKYLISKLGIVTGNHTFKPQKIKRQFSLRISTPQTQRNSISPFKQMLSSRNPIQILSSSRLIDNQNKLQNQTPYNHQTISFTEAL